MFSPLFLREYGEAAQSPRVEKQIMAPLACPVNARPWERKSCRVESSSPKQADPKGEVKAFDCA